MSITLTVSAARQITTYMAECGENIGLRFGVKRTGCSGFAYAVDVADHLTQEDVLLEHRGVKIVVNIEHMPLLERHRDRFRSAGTERQLPFSQSERQWRVWLRREFQYRR